MDDRIGNLITEGIRLQRIGIYSKSIELYKESLQIDPGNIVAKNNLCICLLQTGNFKDGFDLYDVRFDRDIGKLEKPHLSFPEWNGESIYGKSILVWPEQGFGDQIMFSRFISLLSQEGAKITVLTPPPLTRLFGHLPASIISADGSIDIPKHDFWIFLCSIPSRLGISEPGNKPYFPSSKSGCGVGIAYKTRPFPPGRSLPPEILIKLRDRFSAKILEPEFSGAVDFEATREIISRLDLVISVDTAIAHLAGAMGKKVWVLLPTPGDWRWGTEESNSAWYSSAKLFRQKVANNWEGLIEILPSII